MPVLTTYPLDLSGVQVSNRITGEIKTITQSADRVFIPTGGPFYTKSLKVFQGTRLLQPVTDYIALELNRDGSLASGKEVCNVLFIKNTATSFRLEYQVIGGVYSDFSNELIGLINATPLDKLNVLTWGSIIGKPTTFPPTAHSHYPYEWRGYTQLVHLIEQLRLTVVAGDQAQFAAFYQYIDNNLPTIVSDYLDGNGLFFIDRTPTVNGNVLLKGQGTASSPFGIDLAELLDELDVRYFQNSINPLTRIGAISDSFLPVSAGFFNCLAPLANIVSLSAVANVERNGDLLTLLPATNGEIIRYVYGYVRQWSGNPNIQRYKPTNHQYRPPGLANNEEIMDLFGYHEQSMIGSIFTIAADGAATFKENCIIWLNGTFSSADHVVERIGGKLIDACPVKDVPSLYLQSPKICKMRNGSKYLLYFWNASGVNVCKMDNITKTFTPVTNWHGKLRRVIMLPDPDQGIEVEQSVTETTIRTGQDFCRPFAWLEEQKIYPDEEFIFDEVSRTSISTHDWSYANGSRSSIGVCVVGDTIKAFATICHQISINEIATGVYRGGELLELGFSLEIQPTLATPVYKWVRHRRANEVLDAGYGNMTATNQGRGSVEIYEDHGVVTIPVDLHSYLLWHNALQAVSRIQLNDGRLLIFGHPNAYARSINLYNTKNGISKLPRVDWMFSLYHFMRTWAVGAHNGFSFDTGRPSYTILKDKINLPPPTVNAVDSSAMVLADGTVILTEREASPLTVSFTSARITAYRPSATVINYPTVTHGDLNGFNTSDYRIEMAGDYLIGSKGYYDVIPWTSARRADGTTKVGSLVWFKPVGTVPFNEVCHANIGINWATRRFVKTEPYRFTPQGFNTVDDFVTSFVAKVGVNTLGMSWTIIASPEDPNTGIISIYAARADNSANDYILPVKMSWVSGVLTGVVVQNNVLLNNQYSHRHSGIHDPRYAFGRLQWVMEYNAAKTEAYWAGKRANVSIHIGETLSRPDIISLKEVKSGNNSTWTFISAEGTAPGTGGYKSLVATQRGIGMMTDDIGYGVFRGLRPFKSLAYDSGTIFKTEDPFIYVTPRPPSNFVLNITDTIDVQLGGVYGKIEPSTYSLTDPVYSDVVDARNKTILIYVVLELGLPVINFRETPMTENVYSTYIGKCITDSYGVMELEIEPVSRIGNYRPSATPRGSSFSVSSGTADQQRLLNWDANIFGSDGTVDDGLLEIASGSTPGETYNQVIQPGEKYRVLLMSAGGGGGALRSPVDGTSGGPTRCEVLPGTSIVFLAGGGGGTWGTDGAGARNGSHGAKGVATVNPVAFSLSDIRIKPPVKMPGGSFFVPGLIIPGQRHGHGGSGMVTVNAVSGLGYYSGNGAAGNVAEFTIGNDTAAAFTMTITLGSPGISGSSGTFHGGNGYYSVKRFI